ncbi:hypothetical protein [Saccharopolyspora hirsuta]|uniref:hypothetical protein n=1 Tax=Saccharopolyspora hirsuta TaxID=1837 RepID=UPI0012329AA0|nr:hypothetical protein [Saccharopolyspora hirsuta]
MLSDRAVALARRAGDQAARLRAEALALFASNRLGRGVPATGRALAAVRDAESAGDAEVTAELRVELAWCACAAGSPEVAARILRPVLEQERIEPSLRAHALLALAASMPVREQGGARTEALDEAERLYGAGESNRDTARLLRARVCAARAGHHRRLGEFAEATEVADAGLELLGELGDPAADSGEIRTCLVLERVQSLLELGHRLEAVEAAERVLAEPVRAAAAGPVGWLGLALATRVHLPNGDHAAALRVLGDTAAISERHKLDGLLAEALNTLSQVHERGAEFAEALRALRGAYAADRRWRAAVHHARVRLLAEYPELAECVTVPRQSRGPQSAPPEAGPPDVPPPGPQPAPEAADEQQPRAVEPRTVEVPHSEVQSAEASGAESPFPSAESVEAGGAEVRGARVELAEAGAGEGRPDVQAEDRWFPEIASAEARGDDGQGAPESQPAEVQRPEVESAEARGAEDTGSAQLEAAEPDAVASGPELPKPRPESDDAADAARRLMESLTNRAAELREERRQRQEASRSRTPDEPTVVFDSALLDDLTTSTHQESGVLADSAEPEPAGETSGRSDWWPPELRDQPPGEEDTHPDLPVASEPLLGWQTEPEPDPEPAPPGGADATAILPVVEPETTADRHPEERAPRHGTPEPVSTEAAEDEQREPSGSSADQVEENGGRRSRGRSLAEIRASLQLPEQPRGGRRRARRRAEPDEPEAAEAVARHRQPDQTPEAPEPPQAELPDQDTQPNLPVPEPEPAADPGVPEKVGLAELLTEALLAYETGRRGEAEAGATRSGRHSEAHVSGITEPSRLSQTAFTSTSDDRGSGAVARHRRPGIDAAATDPLF